MKKLIKIIISLNLVFLLLSCSKKNEGTNTGNPGNSPVNIISPSTSTLLLNKICKKLISCYETIIFDQCFEQVQLNSNIGNELNLAPEYETFPQIQEAEEKNLITVNLSHFDDCIYDIENSSCTDPQILNSYSTNYPLDFTNSYLILRLSTSCYQSYSKKE